MREMASGLIWINTGKTQCIAPILQSVTQYVTLISWIEQGLQESVLESRF